MVIKFVAATADDEAVLNKLGILGIENIYKLCLSNGEFVGVIEYSEEFDGMLRIDYLSIFTEYRRRGFARKVINKIRAIYRNPMICGESLPCGVSVSFWKSIGANFENDNYEDSLGCLPFFIG